MNVVGSPGLFATFVLRQASQASPLRGQCDQDEIFFRVRLHVPAAYHLSPCSPAQISSVNQQMSQSVVLCLKVEMQGSVFGTTSVVRRRQTRHFKTSLWNLGKCNGPYSLTFYRATNQTSGTGFSCVIHHCVHQKFLKVFASYSLCVGVGLWVW